MYILTLISYLLLAVLLMSMLARTRPWLRQAAPGRQWKIFPMGILPRLWLHRYSLSALLTGIAFGTLAGWLPPNVAGMIGGFALLIVLMPMRYTLTTQGVAVGDGTFYPWSDFSGFAAGRSRLELLRSSFLGRLTLFIKPAEMGSVLDYVERHVKTGNSKS